MRKITPHNMKDCGRIYRNDDTFIFTGKHPWIFRTDGTYVAKISEILYGKNVRFLCDHIAFVDGLKDKTYYYVSLRTGEVLWRCKKIEKRNPIENTAISVDGRTLYCLYNVGPYDTGPLYFVDAMMPDAQQCSTYTIPENILRGPVFCMECDAVGNLDILTFDRSVPHKEGFCAYSLLKISIPEMNVLSRQNLTFDSTDIPVLFNDDYILFRNLRVINRQTGNIFSLVENNPMQIKRDVCYINGYDPTRKLLNICYLYKGSTLIVDCEKRCIAAHYAPITYGQSSGYLYGDEFWIGTSEGVVKRPFPNMDAFPNGL